MTWRDKLEIGLEKDAPFRKDNLPDEQVRGPEIPVGEGRSPEIPAARDDADERAGISEVSPDETDPYANRSKRRPQDVDEPD